MLAERDRGILWLFKKVLRTENLMVIVEEHLNTEKAIIK